MNKKETLILFTGDSITDGLRFKKKDQQWDLNHQMGHSYAYIINGLLGSRFPEKNFRFKNRGVSGNRIVDLYARNEVDLFPIQPDILSILIGVNDARVDQSGYKPTSPKKYETIYRLLLEEVKEYLPQCKIILMEPFICNAGRVKENYPEWQACVHGYAQVVKKLAKEFDCVFVPLQEAFDQQCAKFEPEYWSWDGVHPTENGHGLIAREWLKASKELLGLEKEA